MAVREQSDTQCSRQGRQHEDKQEGEGLLNSSNRKKARVARPEGTGGWRSRKGHCMRPPGMGAINRMAPSSYRENHTQSSLNISAHLTKKNATDVKFKMQRVF